jgi:DNA topoisomerase-1
MKLMIVESPGKVKKLKTILGPGWEVAASVGHVRDLPDKSMGVFPPDFVPRYVPTERGGEVLARLGGLVAKSDEVYLATDPDREGEAIAWHIKEFLGLDNPPRISFSQITEPAVLEALRNPGSIDMDLVRAQESRRVLDRLVGYSVTPLMRGISKKNVTAGRVQSPALRLVVEKERAIRCFDPLTHYSVEFIFDPGEGPKALWRATWNPSNWLPEGHKHFQNLALARRLARVTDFTVESYSEGQYRLPPAAPFVTSTLQQAASNALKMDPKKAMALAQRLYEEGHVTYIRTDNPNLSAEAVEAIRSLARANSWPVPSIPRGFSSGELAQEAHEAIRPTDMNVEAAGENEAERALYRLIRLRAIASQLEEAQFATAKAVLSTELDEKKAFFEAKGRRLVKPGWKVILKGDQANDQINEAVEEEMSNPVPALKVGEALTPAKGEVKIKRTNPPARYTQASLIKDLERLGIGRPSTYASIMENITARGYVTTNARRQLLATCLGEELIDYLVSGFGFLDYNYTRNMEVKLDQIAKGQYDYLSLISGVNQSLEEEIKTFTSKSVLSGCPSCGNPLSRPQGDKEGIIHSAWTCPDGNDSEPRLNDDDIKPDFQTPKKDKENLTDFKCLVCGSLLYRKKGFSHRMGIDYDFFSCSSRNCSQTYKVWEDKPLYSQTEDGGRSKMTGKDKTLH